MTIIPEPSLPSIEKLPYRIAIDGLTGYLCGRLCRVNPYLTAAIFVTRCLADTLFYQLANSLSKNTNLESQKFFLVTFTLVNATFLITLKELYLIGHFPSFIIGIATAGCIISRAIYIQNQERQSIIDEINERQS